MSDTPVQINVVQEQKKRGAWDKFKGLWSKTPPTTTEESNRFSKLGYIQYPKRQQLDMRLYRLEEILQEIETELAVEELDATTFKHIKKLVSAFMTVGSPWFRGLNNRELAHKAVTFYKLESMCGHLPAFYPDLKRCVQVLINLSWQAIDVVAETPVLFETRTVVQPNQGGIDLSGSDSDKQRGRSEEL